VEPLIQGLTVIVLLLVLLSLGVWIGVGLIACAVVTIVFFTSTDPGPVLGGVAWDSMASWTLTALPLFIWMGEILNRTRLSEDMFAGLAPWLQGLPGRLLHVNVIGCGIFAAVSGSSAATAATIGRISLPELASRGYDERLSIGSLAGSGTLGLLIPPSIIMIVYGVAAQVSIGRLFIAGVFPGVMLMGLFSGYIMLWALMNPRRMPARDPQIPWRERIRKLRLLVPVILLIITTMGCIYGGIATATEAAALGVLGALIIAAISGSLTRESFSLALRSALQTNCMLLLILFGAAYLTKAMSYSGLPGAIAAWIATLGLNVYLFIAVLVIFYVLLGCFLDGISMVVLTTSVLLPTVIAFGIDPVWFGIFLVLVVEMAQVTPPVGMNLFVIQGFTGKNIFDIAKMSMPFFLLLVLGTAIITVYPSIALYLVGKMY
jgi:tripartite ATP-independent transporter DctM subunit